MSTVEEVAAELESLRGRQERRAARRERWRVLRRSPTFVVGAVIVGFWAVCAIFGSLLEPHDPFAVNVVHRLTAPSSRNWLGTDELGRDVLSRVIAGARDILIVAPLATAIGTLAGTTIGLVTGFYRGAVDDVLMRLVDAFLAVPVAAPRAGRGRRRRHNRAPARSWPRRHARPRGPRALPERMRSGDARDLPGAGGGAARVTDAAGGRGGPARTAARRRSARARRRGRRLPFRPAPGRGAPRGRALADRARARGRWRG